MPTTGVQHHELRAESNGPRVLCVVAHPDDEIAFAATIFKTAALLDGVCDVFVITNGEGGYKYSTLGEWFYGVELTDPAIGRAELPAIRQREHLAGGRILGFRRVTYLNQTDHRFTRDPFEVLAADAGVWDLELVRSELDRALSDGRYDFVLTHIPSRTTHGHHQAATFLALEAVQRMPLAQRPVALGAHPTTRRRERPAPPEPNAKLTTPGVRTDVGPFAFDRNQTFGYRDKLDYHIVVNWAIAEHKSQGTFQTAAGLWDLETFFLYDIETPNAAQRSEQWFERLEQKQFPTPVYDANGATPAKGSD